MSLVLALIFSSQIMAQDNEPVGGTIDFGPGLVGRNQAENNRNDDPVYWDLGFRVNRYLRDSQRFSFRFSFDYLGSGIRPLLDNWEKTIEIQAKPSSKKDAIIDKVSGKSPPESETLVGHPEISDIGFLPSAGLAFDLIRIPHVNLAVHGGATTLIVNRSARLNTTNLCDYSEYSHVCGFKGELLGNAGFSLRFSSHNFKKNSFYGGIGYTAFTANTRQITLFIGSSF